MNGNNGNPNLPPDSELPVPEILGWVLDHHAATLELYARQLCSEPEDVVQEALIELAGRTVTPDDVVAWLYRVVRNKAINASRAARRRSRRETRAADAKPVWFDASAADAVDARDAADALATLPDDARELIVARLWGGLSFEQIGQLIGTSDSTAHRRYRVALSKLRERLNVPCPKKD